jgi:hypothetical protein
MAGLRASWRTSLSVAQQPRKPQSEFIARSPYYVLTMRAGAGPRRTCATSPCARPTPAPVSGPLLSTRSRRARAPRAWPRAPGAIPRPSWVGCTPITPKGLVRSRSAAPVADPPLRSDRGSAS